MESDRLFCLYTQPYPGGNLPCCHFRFGPNQGFGCGYHPVFANPPHWHQRQEWFTHLDGTSAAVSNGILHCEGRPMILICVYKKTGQVGRGTVTQLTRPVVTITGRAFMFYTDIQLKTLSRRVEAFNMKVIMRRDFMIF